MTDPLEAKAVLLTIPGLLPRSTSSPLPRPTDVIAALVHAIHTALDFRLVNQQPTQSQQEVSPPDHKDIDDGASETETAVENDDESPTGDNMLNEGWNGRGEDTYIFEYRHAQSSLSFRVRVGKMGGRVQVDATAEASSISLYWLSR